MLNLWRDLGCMLKSYCAMIPYCPQKQWWESLLTASEVREDAGARKLAYTARGRMRWHHTLGTTVITIVKVENVSALWSCSSARTHESQGLAANLQQDNGARCQQQHSLNVRKQETAQVCVRGGTNKHISHLFMQRNTIHSDGNEWVMAQRSLFRNLKSTILSLRSTCRRINRV